MPGSADRRSELFARAVDGGAGGPLPDDELRRELAVVGLLFSAGRRVRPDDAARDRMRERILAGLAEPAVATRIDAASRRRSALAGVRGRLLVAAAAALCLLVTLSGMSLVLARDALPGDALYGVKRSAESAELGLTFGNGPRGFKHLRFAAARVDEIEALIARAGVSGSPASAVDADRSVALLQAFDADAAAGSRLLIEAAVADRGSSELIALRDWAEQQRQRIDSASAAMPAMAAARANGSLDLLGRMIGRAAALLDRLRCLTVTSGLRDDIGLRPDGDPCVPATSAPGGPTTGTPGPTHSVAPPPGVIGSTAPPGGQTASLDPLDPGTLVPGGPPAGGLTTVGTVPQGGPATTNITIPLPVPPPIPLPPLQLLPGLTIG